MSLMDLTCGDCGARFRLDSALLKDSNAARILCRKCGGLIVVRLPEESPIPPPLKEVSPKEPTIPLRDGLIRTIDYFRSHPGFL